MKNHTFGFLASRYAAILLLLVAELFSSCPARGQITGQGAVSGTVTDPDGLSIPGAKVDVRNVATNVVISRTATSSGYYVVSPLPPGTYTITVTAPGFSQLLQENVSVDALQTATFNPKLKLGQAAPSKMTSTRSCRSR